MRVLLITEEISVRPDRGLLVFVERLSSHLSDISELTVVYAAGDPPSGPRALRLLSERWLLTHDLVKLLRGESFDIALYVPTSSFSALGLLRASLLKTLVTSPMIVIALQYRRIGKLHALFSRLNTPDIVLTPVGELGLELERLGLRTAFIIPGFDEKRFCPVPPERQKELKRAYGLPVDQFIVLHVGHIRENRNMQVFLKHRDWGRDIVPVVKGGDVEHSWLHRLQMAGIIVFDEYLGKMHELYQAADCYLFPVSSPTDALEFPLSVIEAAACDLPVITTPFGALPEIIREGNGFHYIHSFSDIPARLSQIRSSETRTREKVSALSWDSVFAKYLDPHIRRLSL